MLDPATPEFRITPLRPIDELRREAMAAEPPTEEGPFRTPNLVDLEAIESTLRFDIRYASDRNFMGAAFYAFPKAYLQRPAAAAVLNAAEDLARHGFGLVVYDAYRPWYVTKMFWDATPQELRHFVAPPENGSRHNRGAAIDLGLYDLRSGEVLAMPSGYDEFTERAYADYEGGAPDERTRRDLLRAVMEKHGFTIYPYEWWHFDFKDWRDYPILNVPFEAIGSHTADLV